MKRLFDIQLSLAVLLLLSPALFCAAIAIRTTMGSPILFRQKRPGRLGRAFELLKFRTMTDARDQTGKRLPDGNRITWLGNALRKTSLDELPSLWNVLRGEMSLVGPRPLLMEYLERYDEEQARRHEVTPGVTGWAQINGRNSISWTEKLALDVWYVDHWSLALDLRILLRTFGKVLLREGISHGDCATMSEFRGSGER